jgi:chromosome segregation ATPase
MEKLVSGLEEAVGRLIALNKELQKQLVEIETDRDHLREELEQKEREIESLENRVQAVKTARTLTDSETSGDKEVRKVLNELLRDIDKCIGLLNG